MPEAPKPNEASDEDEQVGQAQLEGDALDLDGLKTRGDVKGLLTLARAYRAGSAPGGRDMKRCYDAYAAAADLGSADAEYAVALFHMTGGIVAQDWKIGSSRLRAAAEKGSVPAKVYLGNLYELGIHYKADPEKADVWYRNAARGARLPTEEEVGAEEHALSLAELGAVRYVLALTSAGKVDEETKSRLLQRARAHGYGLRLKDDSSAGVNVAAGDRPTFLDALSNAEQQGMAPDPQRPERQRTSTSPETRSAKEKLAAMEAKTPPAKPAGPTRGAIAVGAFGYALLFAIAAVGAGYAATVGASELVAHGKMLPGLGAKTHLVFPIVFAVIGVLPTWLVYRLDTVIKAIVIGGAFGGIGWVAWGTGLAAFHANRPIQSLSFGIAGFLAGLLVLGLLGGTKKQPPRPSAPKRAAI